MWVEITKKNITESNLRLKYDNLGVLLIRVLKALDNHIFCYSGLLYTSNIFIENICLCVLYV